MKKYKIEFSSDGCPNDCSYCKDNGFPCIYENSESSLANKPYKCCKCGKDLFGYEVYEYKNFIACEDCFNDVIDEVEEMVDKAAENIESRQHIKLGGPTDYSTKIHLKHFANVLEVQGKESIYEKYLREGKLL